MGALTAAQRASAQFFKSEARGSVLLLLCTITALAWANSPWSKSYFHLLEIKFGFTWDEWKFALSLRHWLNDGLMALFFFVVGLEIKREILVGELSSLKKAILPVAAGAGGMAAPALIYLALNGDGAYARGWGIPMATDIAFALGILTLLGPAVPAGLKVFLTALAIADDLGAVMVIALFYTQEISTGPLIVAGLCVALLAIAVRMRIGHVAVFVVLVAGVWLGVLASGIHATVAGILVAIVVPVRARMKPGRFFATVREKLADLEASNLTGETARLDPEQMEALERLHRATSAVVPAGHAFEHYLHPVTAYLILPLFALFNAGVVLDSGIGGALGHRVSLGVLLGLVLGKQLGITLASWTVIRTGLADLPETVTWRQIYGAATLAGIGFTMSLFVADLAMQDEKLLTSAKMGTLAASTICAVLGYAILRSSFRDAAQRAPATLGVAAVPEH